MSSVDHAPERTAAAPGAAPQPRTTVQVRSTRRQQAMVDAAARLLIEHGFTAVTHRQVARAAGVPQGSASYYFPTSAALVAAAVGAAEDLRARAAREHADALAPRARSARETAREVVATLYAPHVDDTVVDTRLDPMITALRDPALRPLMRASRPRLLAAVRTVLDVSGHGAVDDVDLLAHVVDAALVSAAAREDGHVLDHATSTVARFLDRWT
ncbi:TetR/AcrR family transcriptional regulator [Cellulosimicrobium marinum]|uniref:TetR/AcrR family transcriptional regulator n=1 Tax=Cellulosimicrobium marinum TaxID=1638992 RepID=UPI001E2ADFB7|nr:TetR family transcriptional regulator [Cellulosimicrobium marinum]MCB7135260.1 TetR family transcriptional regulator [Cellulosimicrobium marinum]